MPRCIYCLKNQNSVNFTKREHVIPASFGVFSTFNATITAQDGIVCDVCNGDIFGPLENNFIEDTYEGVMYQRLSLDGRKSVTIRDKEFRIEQSGGFANDFLNRMFCFLKLQDGKFILELKDQIKVKMPKGGYRVFLPEALELIKRDSSTFRKISSDLNKLDHKDINIFGETRERVDYIIALLKDFGVDYKEGNSCSHNFQPGDTFQIEENTTCTINIDLGRVLSKIAFNYFSFCALRSGMKEILYGSEFNKIRCFIHSGVGSLRDIIPSIAEEPIIFQEALNHERIIGHAIVFSLESNNTIVARMTLMGSPAVYKIIIGKLPASITNLDHFGCGHFFNPFNHSIYPLDSSILDDNQSCTQIGSSFGLFRR